MAKKNKMEMMQQEMPMHKGGMPMAMPIIEMHFGATGKEFKDQMPESEDESEIDDAEEALDILTKAQEIKADPEMMGKVEALVKKSNMSLEKIKKILEREDTYVEASITVPKDEILDPNTGEVVLNKNKKKNLKELAEEMDD